LLVAAGLMIRSFQALSNVQPGFTQPETLQTARISIPQTEVAEPERVIRMQNEILGKISANPGVTSAAFATTKPTDDLQSRNLVNIENKTPNGQVGPLLVAKSVSPGLFKTQGTPLLAGRDFTWTDIYERRPVALVSEKLARETWGEVGAALGKRIRIGIVGE